MIWQTFLKHGVFCFDQILFDEKIAEKIVKMLKHNKKCCFS